MLSQCCEQLRQEAEAERPPSLPQQPELRRERLWPPTASALAGLQKKRTPPNVCAQHQHLALDSGVLPAARSR